MTVLLNTERRTVYRIACSLITAATSQIKIVMKRLKSGLKIKINKNLGGLKNVIVQKEREESSYLRLL